MAQLEWQTVKNYEEITFKQWNGVARIAFNRPEVRNAFTPKTVDELGKHSFFVTKAKRLV